MRLGLILLFLPVLMLGIIYHLHIERSLQNDLRQRLLASNYQLQHTFIEPYLNELERQFNQIYQRVRVEDFSGPTLSNTERYLREWALYKGLMADLDSTYVGTARGDFLIYPIPDVLEGYDPRTRPWYRLASQHPDRMVWTDPYQGYGVYQDKLMISLARALPDRNGKERAVVAIDVVLAPFSAQLNRQRGAGYQLIINHAGEVLAGPDPAQLLKPMPQPGWRARFDKAQGVFLDEESGQFVAYRRLPHWHWILVSVQPAADFQAVVTRASFNVLGVVGLASVIYGLLALFWSRYFRRMLDEISSVIRASRQQPDELPRGGMRELRHVYAELAEVSKDYHEARQQANLDKLTGLYNRRFFDERLSQLLSERQPFCLAMLDLDDFKRVNDTFGHQTGDVVLKRVAKLGKQLLGGHGWVCRYGGEELTVLLLNPDIHFCQMLLEQLRIGVASLDWREPGLGITFSGGLVTSAPGLDAKALLERVDAEVYRAKRDGKNRICLGTPLAAGAPVPQGDLMSNEET